MTISGGHPQDLAAIGICWLQPLEVAEYRISAAIPISQRCMVDGQAVVLRPGLDRFLDLGSILFR